LVKGGPVHEQREKTLVFRRESPTMLPPGLSAQATSLRLRIGGFLTWAAKPSVRESPDPAINIEVILTRSPPTGRLLAPWDYVLPAVEVPFAGLPSCFYLDAARILPVAKFWIHSMKRIWNIQGMFC